MEAQPKIGDFEDDFDPFTALTEVGGEGHITDPLVKLEEMGRVCPVVEADLHTLFGVPRQLTLGQDKAYIIIGHDACREALMNDDDFSNAAYNDTVGITFGRSITTMDKPEHPRYRRLFQSAFTPKMLDALRPRFEKRLDMIVSAFEGRGSADLVEEVAKHFPFQFICDLMDLPQGDRATFHKIAAAQACVGFDPEHGQEASRILGEYLSQLIAIRREHGDEDDFMHMIATAEVEGELLPDDVILGFFRQLMNAGGDTSYHGFSNILSALMQHPDQLDAIREDRSLVAPAIEEGIRWGAPITAIDRLAVRDIELDGVLIEKGAIVRVGIAAGNRDARIWRDPHEFNIFREPKRHLGFGYGAHVCVGQHLARMELQTALSVLLDRLPNLRLDPNKPAPTIRGLTFRGADAVHVVWDL